MLRKHTEMGGFLFHASQTSARSSAKSRSSRVENRVHQMLRGWYDVVCCITQSIVRMESKADMGHLCLTPVFTPKLDLRFPTLHLKLL